jgi:predicted aspartyl protease
LTLSELFNQYLHVNQTLNNNEDSSDDEYVFSLKGEKSRDWPKVSVKIEGVDVTMMIDSGASINILDERTLLRKNNLQIHP